MRTLILLLLLASCGSVKVSNEIHNAEYDLLKAETFDRYSKQRMQSYTSLNKINEGLQYCYNGEFEKGINFFKHNLVKNAENALYWNNIAICNKLEGKLQQAMFYLGLAKTHVKTRYQKAIIANNMGVILLKVSKNFEAQNKFEESIKYSKKLLTPRMNLARLFLQYGLYTKALKELHILHAKNVNDIDVNFLLGKAYLLQGNTKRSHFYLTKIPKRYLKRHDLANIYAATLAQMGQFQEAKAVLDNRQSSGMDKLSLATSDLYNFIDTNNK